MSVVSTAANAAPSDGRGLKERCVVPARERNAAEFLQARLPEDWSWPHIEDRIRKRGEAKKAKRYAEADALRKEALEAGIILEDSPQGTTWRRA